MRSATGRALAALAVFAAVCLAGLPRGLARLSVRDEPWGADAPAYCRIARQIAAHGTLRLPPPDRIAPDVQQNLANVWGTPYALGAHGELYPKHPWLFALLLVPGVAVAGTKGAFVTAVLLGGALLAFATHRAARVVGALPALAAGLVLFFLVPAVRTVVLGINVDVAIALAMLACDAAAADGRPFRAGAVAGVSLLLRPTMPLLLLPAVVFFRAEPRARLRAAAGLIPGVVLFAATNALLWGAPWRTAYERAGVVTPSGIRLETHSAHFLANPLRGVAILFANADAGLLYTAPVALLALLGFLLPEARRTEWRAAAAGGAIGLLMLAPYDYLARVPVSNIRFALPLLVTALYPLSAILARGARSVIRPA